VARKSSRLRVAPFPKGSVTDSPQSSIRVTPQSSILDPQSSAHLRVRILGIDPGLAVTGYGVLDRNGARLSYVTSGRIKTPDAELAQRLKAILDGLNEVIESCAPQQVALEKVFVNANPQTTLLLGQARGTAICAAVLHALPVAEYTALQVKQAVVGNGHARKEQVQDMVRRLLKLAGNPSPDAADALACAICHAHGGQGLGRLATAGFRMKRGRLV
jgi:crossover junction endodeoxyribonuclease RuvC